MGDEECVRSTSKKVFFSVCPGDKNSKAYTKLKRFIKIYLSLFHYTLNSKIWKLFTTIQLSATFPTHIKIYKIKLISKGQNSKLISKLLHTLETFYDIFFISNWETSAAALLSCHKWEPWYDCIKNGLIHGQRGMRLIFLMLASIFHPSLPPFLATIYLLPPQGFANHMHINVFT